MDVLRDLPVSSRPFVGLCDGASHSVLTGDYWGPCVCKLLRSEQRTINVMQYAVSPKWPRGAHVQHSIFSAMLELDAKRVNASIILAAHKRSGRSGNFNRAAARRLHEAGWSVRFARPSRLLHAKVWLFGQGVSILGSHNVGYASVASNVDVSLATDSVEIRNQLAAIFARQWGESERYTGD